MSKHSFSHKKLCEKCFKIARIKGGSSKYRNIYLNPEGTQSTKTFESKTIPNGNFQVSPSGERITMFIVGEAGLGKSTYAAQVAKAYKKAHPKNPIVLISPKDYDEPLDKLNALRVSINEENFLDPDDKLTIGDGELDDSLLIFDDIEGINDDKLRKEVDKLKDEALTLGRSKGISVIYISHLATAGPQTRRALYESQYLVFSPRSRLRYQLTNVLKKYMGLNKDQIKKVFDTPCRMVALSKDFPTYVIGSDCIYFL